MLVGHRPRDRRAAGRRRLTVYATARGPESIADLEAAGCKTLALDVNSEESMHAAVETVEAAEGAIGALVNNAGIQEIGAIETLPMDRVRGVFETNVFGPVRLIQLVLPGMREAGAGRIVTVGSMNGKFTWPGTGYYCGTKHALEAISDSLRYEVRPFGIDVVLLEPGFVKTPLGKTAVGRRAEDAATLRELQRRGGRGRDHLHDGHARDAGLHARGGGQGRPKALDATSRERPLPRRALGAPVHGHAQGAAGRRLRRLAALAVPGA